MLVLYEQDGLNHPIRCVGAVQRQLCNLHDNPGDHNVSDTDANDVAALQFLEKIIQRRPELPRDWVTRCWPD